VAALGRGVSTKAGGGDDLPPQPAPWDDVTAPSDTKEEEEGERKEAAAAAKPSAPQQQPQQQHPKALSPAEMAALAQANAQKVQEVIAAARAAGAGGGAGGAAAAAAAPPNSPSSFPRLFDLLVDPSWREALKGEFDKPYARRLEAFVHGEWARNGGRVYPPMHQVFRALNSVPLDQCRVVVLGQDPYHGPAQAEGLSFSVPRGVAVPSSLRNIYKELSDDVPGFRPPGHGSLEAWAHQGVLLLNATLTVRGGDANSHAKASGWLEFTAAVVEALSRRRKGLVFLLWGKFAQDRAAAARVDAKKHHLLKSPHPSGLSAHRGFFGCRHFSAANALLEKEGLPPVDWRLPG
jgi:uracil-DNA glycosylase